MLNFADAFLASEFNFATLIDVPIPPWRVPLHVWMRGLQLDLTMGGRRLEAEDGADLYQ